MNNGQNNQNSVNSQYGNYNSQGNGMVGNPQYNNQNQYGHSQYGTYQNPSMQNQGYQGNNQYQYPQNQGYPQYQQQVPTQNYQYGSNLNYNGIQIQSPKPKKSKKKILIIGGVIFLIIVVVIVVLFLGKSKKGKKNSNNSNSDGTTENVYADIMKQYGTAVEENVSNSIAENGTLPDQKEVLDSTKVEGYTIECGTVEFHYSGKVYLSGCKINETDAIYSYGEPFDDSAIIEDYGAKALTYVSDYAKNNNNRLPVGISVKYEEKVVCEVIEIYDVNTIYLDECTVNDSDKKYSFGYKREDGYVYITYNGLNSEVLRETTTADYMSDEIVKTQIKCSTNKCSLDKFLGPYVAVKESDGRVILHNVQSTSSLFTVASNLKYTFVSKEGTEVYGLLFQNVNGQEAVYSLEDNAMLQEYGKYYYNWDGIDSTSLWDKYPKAMTRSLLIPAQKAVNGKYGLISLRTGKEILPFEYDSMFVDDEYINVVKNNKRGLISKDGSRVLLGGNYYEELAFANYQEKYVMIYDNDQLQIINLDGKLIKKVAEIPRGYVLMKEAGYSPMTYKEENGKAIFTVLFRTDKVGNPCAKYTYNLTNSDLNIDENKCEAFKN